MGRRRKEEKKRARTRNRGIDWPAKGSPAEVIAEQWQREWDAKPHPPRDSWSETHTEEAHELIRASRERIRAEVLAKTKKPPDK